MFYFYAQQEDEGPRALGARRRKFANLLLGAALSLVLCEPKSCNKK